MTKAKFIAFEKVRESGRVNMFDINRVIASSGNILTKLICQDIMKNYSKYEKEYL